jgi:hypothetical protein
MTYTVIISFVKSRFVFGIDLLDISIKLLNILTDFFTIFFRYTNVLHIRRDVYQGSTNTLKCMYVYGVGHKNQPLHRDLK